MSYKPIMSGGVAVEVDKNEYEKLVRDSEKIAAVKRFIESSDYPTIKEISAILDIGNEGE